VQIPAEMVHYGMTKTTQIRVARGIGESIAGTGVTANSILAGPTESEAWRGSRRNMTKQSQRVFPVRLAHEAVFSLNIGFAVAYALVTYISSTRGASLGRQVVSTFNDGLHLNKNGTVGLELAFVVPMAGVALFLLLLLLLLRLGAPALGRVILDPVACLTALGAAPACWIFAILSVRPGLVWFSGYPAWPRESGFSFVCLEVSAMLALLYAARKYRIPLWGSLAFLAVHYAFWAWYMWPDIVHRFWLTPSLALTAIVCPCSGLAWFLYASVNRDAMRSAA